MISSNMASLKISLFFKLLMKTAMIMIRLGKRIFRLAFLSELINLMTFTIDKSIP